MVGNTAPGQVVLDISGISGHVSISSQSFTLEEKKKRENLRLDFF